MKRLTHEIFMEKFRLSGNPDIEVIEKYSRQQDKILIRCKKCNHEAYVYPRNLLLGRGCGVCANKVILPNVNSLGYLHPDLLVYFENKDDAFIISEFSPKIINLQCPLCGAKRKLTAEKLTKKGFSCQVCGSGISYPNRYIRNFILLLKDEIEEYDFEWSPDWAGRYRYDAYFSKNNQQYIIEMQGKQHYGEGWSIYYDELNVEEHDQIKVDLAIQNNVIPIIINARKSNSDFIKSNILNSILSNIFDLDNFNWYLCNMRSTDSIIKDVCDEYNTEQFTITELSQRFFVSTVTISTYLKIGKDLGWTKYDPQTEHSKMLKKISKPIDVFQDGKLIYSFQSCREAAREMNKLYQLGVDSTTIGRRATRYPDKPYKGFCFYYAK